MSGLDAGKLADLQERWGNVALATPERIVDQLAEIKRITTGLEAMGLDIEADATYELLAPGLTRLAVMQKCTEARAVHLLDTFYISQRVSGDTYLGQRASRQRTALKHLLAYRIPAYEEQLASAALPDSINVIQAHQLAFIFDLQKNGVFDAQLKKLANECAVEGFRTVHERHNTLQKDPAKFSFAAAQEALSETKCTLEAIAESGDAYQPGPVPSGYDLFGSFTKDTIQFEAATLLAYRETFALKACQDLFEKTVKFQADGHFVLDFSGSGHGAMGLPMQRIVEQLQDNGLNPLDKTVYTRMGVDEAVFWAAYTQERQVVAQDPKHSKLLKPEFNRQP